MEPLPRRAKSKGAPGLAFETWDPSNQFLLEIPTLLFVIPSDLQFHFTPHQCSVELQNPLFHILVIAVTIAAL
jgi:hypothetical protein